MELRFSLPSVVCVIDETEEYRTSPPPSKWAKAIWRSSTSRNLTRSYCSLLLLVWLRGQRHRAYRSPSSPIGGFHIKQPNLDVASEITRRTLARAGAWSVSVIAVAATAPLAAASTTPALYYVIYPGRIQRFTPGLTRDSTIVVSDVATDAPAAGLPVTFSVSDSSVITVSPDGQNFSSGFTGVTDRNGEVVVFTHAANTATRGQTAEVVAVFPNDTSIININIV